MLIVAAACSSPASPPIGETLRVNAKNATLQIENLSNQRIFYFSYEREAAALINWAPCVDASRCASLAGGAQTTVPYSTIGGYAPGKTQAILWWWYAVPAPGPGSVPSGIAAVVVQL